jgi:hypothetical protein
MVLHIDALFCIRLSRYGLGELGLSFPYSIGSIDKRVYFLARPYFVYYSMFLIQSLKLFNKTDVRSDIFLSFEYFSKLIIDGEI